MRIAGVRTPTGRMVWIDAGDVPLSLLQRVTALVDDEPVDGQIYVVPELLTVPPTGIDGVLVNHVTLNCDESECKRLPGSEFPPLGSQREYRGEPWIVHTLHHESCTVHLVAEDGREATVSLSEVEDG